MMVGKCRNGMRRVELRGLCLADSRQNCRGDECEGNMKTCAKGPIGGQGKR